MSDERRRVSDKYIDDLCERLSKHSTAIAKHAITLEGMSYRLEVIEGRTEATFLRTEDTFNRIDDVHKLIAGDGVKIGYAETTRNIDARVKYLETKPHHLRVIMVTIAVILNTVVAAFALLK